MTEDINLIVDEYVENADARRFLKAALNTFIEENIDLEIASWRGVRNGDFKGYEVIEELHELKQDLLGNHSPQKEKA